MTKTAKRKFKRKIPKAYLRDLHRLVNLCFTRATALGYNTVQSLAVKAELTPTCVHRLKECETRLPEYLTVWKLCRALRLLQQFKAFEAKHHGRGPEPSLVCSV